MWSLNGRVGQQRGALLAATALAGMMLAGPALAQSVSPPQIEDLIPNYADYVPSTGPITFDSVAGEAVYAGCFTIIGETPAGVCSGLPDTAVFAFDGQGRTITSWPDASNSFAREYAYTIIDTQVFNTTMIGGGVTANVRIAGSSTVLATATALTLDDALVQAQALTDLSGVRGRILPATVTTSGVVESVTTTSSSVLTGQTIQPVTTLVVGPGTITTGGRGECNADFTVCEGGVILTVISGQVNIETAIHLTLTTTTTIEQTVTSTGLALIDIPIAAPGYSHAGAQIVGFDQSDRFLGRIATPGALGMARVGDDGWSMFVEAADMGETIGARGVTMDQRSSFRGVRGGLAYAVNPRLTIGVAGEGGDQHWSTADTFYAERFSGDGFRAGAFAVLDSGPIRLGLAAFGGRQDIETTGVSFAGAGTSTAKFHATQWGVDASAAWPIVSGRLTLTPRVGVAILGWSAPAYVESGGLAPLSVDSASRTQVRPEAALEVAYDFELGDQARLTLGATGRAFAITGDTEGSVTARDIATPGGFDIVTPGQGQSGGDLGAFATLTAGRATMYVGYSHRFSEHSEDSDSGVAGVRLSF